jgi:DNA-binding beta-propeller fold protein YncE
VDAGGNIYVAGARGAIWKFSPTGQQNAVWEVPSLSEGAVGGIAVDRDGSIYLTDSANGRLVKLSPSGHVAIVGTRGSGPGQFDTPRGVAIGADGHVYVADAGNGRLEAFSSVGKVVGAWDLAQLMGEPPGSVYPSGLAIDGAGNIYVSEPSNDMIIELSPEVAFRKQWGGRGSRPGQFRSPLGLTVNQQGDVYVADTINNRVQMFSAGGRLLDVVGTKGALPGQFDLPSSVAVDAQGDVYVAEVDNNRVQKFSPG